MRPLMTLLVGITLLAAPGMRAQTAPASTTAKKPAAKSGDAKVAGTAQAKPPAKARVKSPAPTAKAVSVKKIAASEQKIARRDPFESLVGRKQAQDAMAKNLPPGKAGLQVATLRLDGIVKASNGMIAVVANPQQRTYFLREGDQLYDGRVEKISMEGVTFHEEGKDAFGKPVERQVNKRLYSSAGEQQ
jgi:Tfp pilus assembly protein PilP